MKMIKTGALVVATAGMLAFTAAPSMAQVSFGVHVGTRHHHYYSHRRYYGDRGGVSFGFGYAPGYYDYDYGYPYYNDYYSNCWVWSPYWGRYVRSGYCD